MAEATGTVRACALCGTEFEVDGFVAIERWTRQEVDSHEVRPAVRARAEVDGTGEHTFYFCQWRHLGMFQADCGVQSKTLREREG